MFYSAADCAVAASAAKKDVSVCQHHSWHRIPIYLSRFLPLQRTPTRIFETVSYGGFANIGYIWPLFGQNQLHSKIKYKTHPRSPATVVQADIVFDFG